LDKLCFERIKNRTEDCENLFPINNTITTTEPDPSTDPPDANNESEMEESINDLNVGRRQKTKDNGISFRN